MWLNKIICFKLYPELFLETISEAFKSDYLHQVFKLKNVSVTHKVF